VLTVIGYLPADKVGEVKNWRIEYDCHESPLANRREVTEVPGAPPMDTATIESCFPRYLTVKETLVADLT
jgi:hypothetical protein